MQAKTIMVQGTSSNVGKSILVTALCRIFRQDGYRVAPFKSQNMSLNSYVTKDGGEIGRAQGVQAEAAGIEATVDMNPILLKPKKDMVAQVIVRGRPLGDMSAMEYRSDYVLKALEIVRGSLDRLRSEFDVVVIEGAGSPAEVNLRDRDIANMRVAELAGSPVILVGDIDRGGVFASIIGTLELLLPGERGRVAGFIINKFRGDVRLLEPGLDFLEERTGLPVFGVIPYLDNMGIDAEDSVALTELVGNEPGGPGGSLGLDGSDGPAGLVGPVEPYGPGRAGGPAWGPAGRGRPDNDELCISVIRLPHISNFTDFDPLSKEPFTRVRYVQSPKDLDNADVIILPGTKNTSEDLVCLYGCGLASKIMEKAKAGIPVVGICGGYQMLGRHLHDPFHAESDRNYLRGLGLVDISTTFDPDKVTTRVVGEVVADGLGPLAQASGERVEGYEIHMGRTVLSEGAFPVFRITERGGRAVGDRAVEGRAVLNAPVLNAQPSGVAASGEGAPEGVGECFDGAVSNDGLIFGTYIHGLFDLPGFRRKWINGLRALKGLAPIDSISGPGAASGERDRNYDLLADVVRRNLKMDLLYKVMGLRG